MPSNLSRTLRILAAALLSVAFSTGCSETDPSKFNNGIPGDVGNNGGTDAVITPDMGGGEEDLGPDLPDIDESKLFSVVTFNAQRFFDTECNSGNCGNDEFELDPSQAEFDFRADQVADAIREVDADAVLLQELENEAVLDAIHSRVSTRYPVSVFGETGFTASLDVAVLSDGALITVRKHGDMTLMRPDGSTTSFSREFLEVHVDVAGHRVILFNAHFKAKFNDDPGRRIAEAGAAHGIVTASAGEFPQALVVLGGDINDTPGSETLDALTEMGELELVTQPNPETFTTFWYRGEETAIDHLLFAPTPGGALYPRSAEVVRDTSGGLAGSDHAALVADFIMQ